MKILKKIYIYSCFRDNIWDTNLANMQLINKYNKGILVSLCVIGICRICAWVVFLTDKKCVTNTKFSQKDLIESSGKPNKRWVDKDSDQ